MSVANFDEEETFGDGVTVGMSDDEEVAVLDVSEESSVAAPTTLPKQISLISSSAPEASLPKVTPPLSSKTGLMSGIKRTGMTESELQSISHKIIRGSTESRSASPSVIQRQSIDKV
jgi:hypothetical protein